MQFAETVWPAVAFLPVFAFVTGMAIAALVASLGHGVLSGISGFLAGAACSVGALALLCTALHMIEPNLFERQFIANRATATAAFSAIGALAGVLYVRGFRFTELWRRRSID
ncbi:MAG: hypothetical protein U1E46_11425 [Hyphomicrobiales bacterium]